MSTHDHHITRDDAMLAALEGAADAAYERAPTLVKDLMSADVATCRREDRGARPAQLMWEHDCGIIPVVDDLGVPIAVVTDRDVCMAAYTQGKTLQEIVVDTAMSRRLFVARAEDTVAAAERTMRLHGVRRLPVVDRSGLLVGVLSLDDIAAHGFVGSARSRDALTPQAIAVTVAAVGYPHER